MIDLINVNKQYNGRLVLKKINLSLPRFGLVIINGPSGCGKSTLLNILSSLIDFDGDISFDGKRYKSMSGSEKDSLRNKKIGFIFQDYKLFEYETVRSNILLSIDLSSHDKESKKEKRVEDLLKLVDLYHKENKLVSNLSGGEKQRVAIARAIANSPSLLLADEPTGNLDKRNSEIIMELIKKISASSLVILVSHDEELTNRYADRIIKMKDGMIIFDIYQSKSKHSDYLPILELKYDNKRRSLPFNFLFSHTTNSIKRRKWRTLFISASTSFGLLGMGLASTLSEIVSTNLYRSYSSIIDSDKIIVSPKSSSSTKDIITSTSYEEAKETASFAPGVKNIGVYYWNTNYLFASEDYLSLDTEITRPIGSFSSDHINQFDALENNRNTIYPKNISKLNDNEIVLSMPLLVISEICYQLNISKSVNSLSNYLEHHELKMKFVFTNDNWGYLNEVPLVLKGFTLSNKSLIYHSNPMWNQFIFEDMCKLPSTSYINVNSDKPWNLIKSYYLNFSYGRDEFLKEHRFSINSSDLDFELLDKKYLPKLYENTPTFECNRVLMVHRSNKDDIPSFVGDYCKKTSKGIFEVTYGSNNGYSIYEQSLMMGFSKNTYISSREDYITDITDNMSYIKYVDSLNVKLPDEIVEGHFSKSNLNGFVFEPHYQLITGREPASYQEILISESLSIKLGYTNPINKTLYLSFPLKEDVLANGFISREYKTVELKITGITDSGKLAISHDEEWSILFFQIMLGVSTFELRINNLAIRINEDIESQLIVKLNRAFPSLSITSPLKDVKNSIEKICNYIELIMLVASITSIVIAGLILFICNYLHYVEVKKDIGLVRCLGVNEKESRKFVYCHSFIMSGLSLLFASIELVVISFVLSKALSGTLMIESVFVFNPISLLYMFLLAIFISLITSIFISMKTKKLNALECLQ